MASKPKKDIVKKRQSKIYKKDFVLEYSTGKKPVKKVVEVKKATSAEK